MSKTCRICKEEKPYSEFYKHSQKKGRLATKRYKRKRRQVHRMATPVWFNREKVDKIYENAKERQLVVDHIIPLNSNLVCGLHCEANLKAISWDENLQKGNRCWPDMP